MKTTLDLPEHLVREMKLRAAREGKKLREVVTEVVKRGLAVHVTTDSAMTKRVKLPLIECRRALSDDELNPEEIAEMLTVQEAKWSDEATRR